MAALSSDFDSQTSKSTMDETLGSSECASDDEFVHIDLTSSQKDSAMAALSTIFQSENAIEGDWVALSSPAIKVRTLEVFNSSPGPSEEKPTHIEARDISACRTFHYKNLRTTSADPAPDIDPTRRETYLSEEEFGSLFGMNKLQFYALPKWKQAQRKLDLDLF